MRTTFLVVTICFFCLPVSSFSRSRLDSVNCGKNMSRLDAEKCAEIKRVRASTKKSSPATIKSNPEWDTQGRHYTPAGGGNLIRDDGAFMQKAAGGYIDTTTGQFYPSN